MQQSMLASFPGSPPSSLFYIRLFGVLYRWLDRWTRLPANFLTPRALESLRTIIIGSWQPTHWHCTRFKSARRQKVGWQSCPSIEPSVEHSKKPTSTLIRASFSFFWTRVLSYVDVGHMHSGHDTERVISVRT